MNGDARLKSRDVAKALRIHISDVPGLVRRGVLTGEKSGRIYLYDAAEVERLVGERSGLHSIVEARGRIAELEAENKALRGRLADARGERDYEAERARTELTDEAEKALALLSPQQALEALGSFYLDGADTWRKQRALQQLVDREEAPSFLGTRPKGVHKDAKSRRIATASGRIEIWYWKVKTGWCARVAGPRPHTRILESTLADALRVAVKAARHTYGKPIRLTSQRLRFDILRRDGFACHYCGRKPPAVELHVDHIVPVADGGTNDPDNLVAACADCNMGKSDR